MHQLNGLPSGQIQHVAPARMVAGSASGDSAVGKPLPSRRGFLQIVSGILVSNLTGCATWRNASRTKSELPPDLPMPDLVRHLNSNIDRINSWRCDNVKISAEGARFLTPSLAADMAIERPRNFRLRAKALNMDMVDLGSNEERFWFWGKEENIVLTARHDQMAAAQRQLPLPFEPDWLIEALGVIPLDESEIEFERHPNELKQVVFKRQRKAPDGMPVELVSTVDTVLGVILEHRLVSRGGKTIAVAKMSEHERNGDSSIVLAHSVALSWPQAQLGLKLRMGAIEINPESLPRQLFAMPDMKCEVVDIGGDGRESQQVVHEAPQPKATRRGKARL